MARLEYDKIYYFRYDNPSTKNLKVWDKAPLVIALDITPKSLLAINVHWVPPKVRPLFIEFLVQYFKDAKRPGTRRKALRLWYGRMKSNAALRPFLVALRRYHISRIKNLQEIPKEKWDAVHKNKFKANIYTRP